jgi:hypothetical protein
MLYYTLVILKPGRFTWVQGGPVIRASRCTDAVVTIRTPAVSRNVNCLVEVIDNCIAVVRPVICAGWVDQVHAAGALCPWRHLDGSLEQAPDDPPDMHRAQVPYQLAVYDLHAGHTAGRQKQRIVVQQSRSLATLS